MDYVTAAVLYHAKMVMPSEKLKNNLPVLGFTDEEQERVFRLRDRLGLEYTGESQAVDQEDIYPDMFIGNIDCFRNFLTNKKNFKRYINVPENPKTVTLTINHSQGADVMNEHLMKEFCKAIKDKSLPYELPNCEFKYGNEGEDLSSLDDQIGILQTHFNGLLKDRENV